MEIKVLTGEEAGLDEERIKRNTSAIIDLLSGSGAGFLEAIVTVALLKETFINVWDEDEGGDDGLPVE